MVEKKKAAVYIEPALWRRVKIAAAKNDKTLSDVVKEALEAWLEKNEKP